MGDSLKYVVTNNLVGIISEKGGITIHLFDHLLRIMFKQRFASDRQEGIPLRQYLKLNSEQTLGQEEYFQQELNRLSQTQSSLGIYGWDAELMNREQYLRALAQLTQRDNPIAISMIIPNDVDPAKLETIAAKAYICRIPENPEQGYTIFDGAHVSYWDSKIPSPRLLEADSIIYRVHYTPSGAELLELLKHFSQQLVTAKK